jgi:signal transduction histidine kinase
MSLIKKFLLFFLLTSILPLTLLGFFLVRESQEKLNQRFVNLLHTAETLVLGAYKNDLDALKLINDQVSILSINDEYQEYLNGSQGDRLEEILNKFQQNQDLGIVALIDAKQKVIASTDTFEYASKDSINELIQTALRGKSISSVERLKFLDDTKSNKESAKQELMYVAASPLLDEKDTKKVNGVLLIGRFIKEKNSFQKIEKSLPIIRITVSDSQLSSNKISLQVTPSTALNLFQSLQNKNEKINLAHSKRLIALRNYAGQIIGNLEVSISMAPELELQKRNLFLMGLFLCFAVIGIISAGFWFNRNFIFPMNQLSEACRKLATGNMQTLITASKAKGEMRLTIDGFNQMVRQLQEKQQMQSDFISTLTHDLKTPLLAQKRACELIEEFEGGMQTSSVKLIHGLHSNNQHLLNMVNLLLETYKSDFEGIQLKKSLVNLFSLVEECKANLGLLAESKEIQILNTIPKEAELEVDPVQLKRVFVNIIGNSIENIGKNSQITVLLNDLDQKCRITIADNGPGISEEILPRIFEKYYSRSRMNQKIGSGLGLYICKLIVEAHGGQIFATSNTNMPESSISHKHELADQIKKQVENLSKIENNKSSGTSFIIELPK